MASLTGKVALVTGGSRGIGAAIVRRLARDGADVAFTYVSAPEKARAVAKDVEALGRRALPLRADAADPAQVTAAVDNAAAELGRLDVLVNNAGVAVMGPVVETSLADLDRLLNVNVRGVVVATQAALRHMQEGSRIINIGSCLAERVAEPNITLYSMTKAALVGLTKGLARDLGPRGITANVVHPGPIDTDMNPADGPYAEGQRKLVALGHYGTGDDIAAAVAHLASDDAKFITGAAVAVDGGYAA